MTKVDTLVTQLEESAWLAPLASVEFLGNDGAQYAAVLLLVLLVVAGTKGLVWLLRRHAMRFTSKTKNALDDLVFKIFDRSVVFIVGLGMFYWGVLSLNFSAGVDAFFEKAVFVVITLKVTRELEVFLSFLIEQYLTPLTRRQKGFMKTFIPPILKLSRFALWSFAVLLILNNLGYKISSLLAGLGIGGIALALGAQEALSNFFGSLMILTDQPFRKGDWVKVEGYEGEIVEVGVRSTKIETVDKSVVSLPNKTVAAAVIENFSRRDMVKTKMILDFEYSTSLRKMQELIKAIEGILKKDRDVDTKTARVHFLEFGESALKLEVFFYIKEAKSYRRMLDIRQRINLKIKETTEKMGAEMAFPTRSLHIANANDFLKTPARRKTNR